jgi:hypothetical protein
MEISIHLQGLSYGGFHKSSSPITWGYTQALSSILRGSHMSSRDFLQEYSWISKHYLWAAVSRLSSVIEVWYRNLLTDCFVVVLVDLQGLISAEVWGILNCSADFYPDQNIWYSDPIKFYRYAVGIQPDSFIFDRNPCCGNLIDSHDMDPMKSYSTSDRNWFRIRQLR